MQTADTILTGGRIFLGLAEGFAEALAVAGGRILAVGTAGEIAAHQGSETRVIELAGRAVTPGLIDAHMHLLTLGLGMEELNLRTEAGTTSVAIVLERVAAAARNAAPGEWIKGRGYDHNELAEGRHPTLAELDAVAPDNPVFLERTCGHMGVGNSAAMRLAGIGHNTPDPAGGIIERGPGGLTGLLAERAMRPMVEAMPRPDQERMVRAIETAGRFMLTQGFTGAMDAAIGMNTGWDEVAAFETAARDGRLPLDIWACLYGDPGGVVPRAHAEGLVMGHRTGRLRYGAAKVFTDGSAGSLTAAMTQPYQVGPAENHGVLCFDTGDVHDWLRSYHQMGYQLAIHAIGDTAIEQVLSGIEAADTPEHPIRDRRHRIEHCGYLTEGQLARMIAAGVYPAPQPIFMYEFGDLYVTNLGPERAAAAYPMRSWMAAGLLPSASSDAPVATTNPFQSLYTMVTRKSRAGTVIGPEQCLSMAEAVHAYTHCAAFSQFAEGEVGRLLPGMRANIAVFSADIFAVSPETVLTGVGVDLTLLDGEIVHAAAA